MPPLNPQQVRVIDPILTTHVQGYRHPDMVGENLFPRVPVEISGGQVIEFGKESFQQYNARRAPGAATKRIDFGYLGKPFALVQDSLEGKVPREFQRDASRVPGIDLGTRATNTVMRSLLLGLEIEQAGIALDANNYDVNHKVALAGTDKWSDPGGKPSTDIEDAKEAVRASIGVYPNVVVLSAVSFKAAKTNPNVIERFKYTSSDSITEAMLAKLWDVEKVVVGKAVKADDAGAFSDVWGNNAVVAYVPMTVNGVEEPSYAYTYTMSGHPLVEQPYYDNNAKSWIYGVTMERVPVLTGITAGFLIQNPN